MKNSKENKKSKPYLSEDKQSKSIDNEKSKKNIEKIREKEKFLVNKYSKLQKAEEKKSDSQAKKDLLNKIYLNIFIYTLNKNLKKNENFEISSKNFVEKQNCESNVEYYRTDYKNQKFSKKFVIDSEKNEIYKTAKLSTNKIKFKNGRAQENENKNNYKRKNIKLNKNEIYENNPNEYYEENNKKLKLNDVYVNKYKLCRNDYLDEFTIKAMNGYNDLTFCNVQDEHEDTEDDEETKKANEDNKDILNVIKETLNIKDVKFSDNLRNHPVSLTTTGDISIEMEKVLKAMPNNEGVKAEKVMMINKNHPIYDKLISLYNKDDNKELKDYSKVLYNMALLINGLSIENPNELSEIVCDMIAK